MPTLRVSSVGPSFRRCGLVFTSKASVVEVTDAQAEILRAEKQLVVRAVRTGESAETPPAEELAAELQSVRADLRNHAGAAGEEIAKLRAMLADARAENAMIAKANSAARDRIAELEALLVDARKGCDELALKLADAREENARLTAELSEATAPKSSEPPASKPAPSGKPSK